MLLIKFDIWTYMFSVSQEEQNEEDATEKDDADEGEEGKHNNFFRLGNKLLMFSKLKKMA